ncbi:MAG: DUF4350 domain-containing protein [Chloroflexota bacterium]
METSPEPVGRRAVGRMLRTRADLVVVCVLFAALLASGIASFLRHAGESGTGTPYSTYAATPDGMLALYLWLGRRGYRVRRIQDAPFVLPSTLGALFVVAPAVAYSHDEARALVAWIAAGGTAIIALDSPDQSLLAALGARLSPVSRRVVAVAAQPLLWRPPLTRLATPPAVGVRFDAPDGVAYLRAGTAPGAAAVLARRALGRGTVFLLGVPAALSNGEIRRGENRRLALNMLADLPKEAPVGFDEFHQGIQVSGARGVGDLLVTTAPGRALLYGGLLVLIYLVWSGRRLGQPLVARQPPARSIAEYIVSVGALYRRSGVRSDALATLTRAFVDEIRETRHLDARAVPPGDLAALTLALQDRGLLDAGGATELQALLTPGPDAPLSERELLRRVRALDAARARIEA